MSRKLMYLVVAATAISVQAVNSPVANAQVTVTVDSTATGDVREDGESGWQGFMNVFNLDRSGSIPAIGDFVFASPWGFGDLVAEFSDGSLTLSPNVIADPNEFWYLNTTGEAADPVNPGGPGQLGNKWMDANAFIETTDTFAGQTVTFEGTISSNSFTDNHTVRVFIRDFAPDFSTNVESSEVVTTGAFSISLATDAGAGRHVQYGFNVQGENVWSTDVAPFGNVVIEDVGATTLLGDFDGSGVVDCADLDGYVGNIGSAADGELAVLDLDGDGTLSADDANTLITTLVQTSNGQVGTFPGDLNCDGTVNVLGDAFALVGNLNNTVTTYSAGDLNFDGTVNVLGDAFTLIGNLNNTNNP